MGVAYGMGRDLRAVAGWEYQNGEPCVPEKERRVVGSGE